MNLRERSQRARRPPGRGESLGTPTPRVRATRARRVAIGAVLLFLGAAYVLALRTPSVGTFHDDGIYLVTAKALAEGSGYRITSLPEPIPQTKYPPVFPAMLSIVWRIAPEFPQNLLLLKLVPFAGLLVWCALVHRTLLRWTGDRRASLVITLLTAASPWILFLGTSLLAETWFAAFTWATLLGLVRLQRGQKRQGAALHIALLAGAAVLARTAGIALIAAGALGLLRTRWRSAVRFASVAGLCGLTWGAWALSRQGEVPADLATWYGGTNYASWNLIFGFGWPEKLEILGWNVLHLLLSPFALMGAVPGPLWSFLLLTGSLLLIGFVVDARRRGGVIHLFAGLYVVLVLLWAWPPARFLAPIYPLLLLFLWRGLRATLGRCRLPAFFRRAIRTAVLVVVCGWSATTVARSAWSARVTGIACPRPACTERWNEFREVLGWIQRTTPSDAVLLGNLDPMLHLYTGRPAARPFTADPYLLYYASERSAPLGTPQELVARIGALGASYIVSTPHGLFGEDTPWQALLERTAQTYPGLLEESFRGTNPGFRVFRVRGVGTEKDSTAASRTEGVQRTPHLPLADPISGGRIRPGRGAVPGAGGHSGGGTPMRRRIRRNGATAEAPGLCSNRFTLSSGSLCRS